MKKLLILIAALALTFSLAACGGGNDDPDPVDLVVTLSGLVDQEITAGDAIDLLDGVSAMGTDGVDYTSVITLDSDDCPLTNGTINTANPATCHITYTAVVEGKMVRDTITVIINPVEIGPVEGPILKEWHWDTDADLEGWTKYEADGGAVVASVDNGALKLEVTSATTVYGARYEFMGLPFEDGEAYEFSFKAKTDVAGKGIHFQVGELLGGAPYFYDFKTGQVEDFGLTTEFVTYTVSFVYNQDLDSGFGGPLFEMGNLENAAEGISSIGINATIWIDDFVIKGGSGEDTLAPTITGAEDVTLYIEDAPTFDAATGVMANDLTDGDLTSAIVVSGDTVDVATAGVYFVTYTVEDAAGNETVVTRTVTVMNDTVGPVLSGVEDAIFFLGDGQDALTGVMAVDGRDGDVTADIVLSGDTFDGATEGTYNVTYTVMDAAMNETVVTREIQVLDVTFVDYTDNLVNPNFDAGNWHPYWEEWNGADAFFSTGDNGLVIDIAAVGADFWHVLIEQEGIVLEANKTYKLSFDASSTVARDIQAEIAGASGITIDGQEFQATISLTETVTTFTLDIVVGDTATGGTLKFLMGLVNDAAASVITLDNVMLEEFDGTAIVADTDQVMDGSFDNWQTTGWGVWSPNGNTSFQTQWREAWVYYDEANANPWENKLEQTGITMIPGLVYKVTFNAKGDVARDFIVGFWDGGTAFEKSFELGTDFQTYTWIFTYTGGTNAALEFKLGKSSDNFDGTLFIVDTIMIEVEDAVPVVEDPVWTGYNMTVVEGDLGPNDVTITYDGVSDPWWNDNAQYSNIVFDGNNDAIDFTFTGTDGAPIVFKVEGWGGNIEGRMTADGTEQMFTLDLSSLTKEQRDAINLLIIFVESPGASGSLALSFEAKTLPAWAGYNMTVVEGDLGANDVTITYDGVSDPWWNDNAQYQNFVFDGTNDAIEFTFTGTDGAPIVFKVEGWGGNIEGRMTADGTEQTFVLDLSSLTLEQRNDINLIIIFVESPGATGTIALSFDGIVQTT